MINECELRFLEKIFMSNKKSYSIKSTSFNSILYSLKFQLIKTIFHIMFLKIKQLNFTISEECITDVKLWSNHKAWCIAFILLLSKLICSYHLYNLRACTKEFTCNVFLKYHVSVKIVPTRKIRPSIIFKDARNIIPTPK